VRQKLKLFSEWQPESAVAQAGVELGFKATVHLAATGKNLLQLATNCPVCRHIAQR